MITLALACLGLILLSGAFYLFPRYREQDRPADESGANLEWYRLRQAELAEEQNLDLAEDARLRLLEDADSSSAEAAAVAADTQGFPRWLLFPVVAILSVLLYWQLGAARDVTISRQLQTLDVESTPAQMNALIAAIESRAAQRPDNLHYSALLGRFYMGRQDYQRAATIYRDLADAAPGDAQALAYAAQAEFLAAGRVLDDESRLLAEQALAVDPHQRTALGLLGMASFEQGQYRAAIEYWERLLVTETPGSDSANMIASVVQRARENLGETAPETTVAAAAVPVETGVTVTVAMPEGANYGPGDTVFVLARNPDSGSRMPIAVQRLSASQLPATLRLSDANSMAGQKISEADSVLVVVQVSPNGQPGEASATWLGQAGPVSPGADPDPLEILLSPKPG
jgi:cytochrome c-type biogenesis protein CcmH